MEQDDSTKSRFPKVRFALGALLVLTCFGLALFGLQHDPDNSSSNLSKMLDRETLSSSAILVGNMMTGVPFLVLAGILAYMTRKAYQHIPFQWSMFLLVIIFLADGVSHIISSLFLIHDSAFEVALAVSRVVAALVAMGTIMTFPPLIRKRLKLYQDAAKAQERQRKIVELNSTLEERIEERTCELQRSEARAHELAGHVVAAQQNERKNLSYEVHDGITQVATAAYQQLQIFQAKYPDGPGNPEDLDGYHEELDQAVKLARLPVRDSRRLIEELRPTVLDDFGLPAAIRQVVQERNDQGWSIELEISLPDEAYIQRCHPEAETALYRVCLEALQNIHKHARASRVWISLEITGVQGERPHTVLTITDNGIGFDTCRVDHADETSCSPHNLGRSIGLKSMTERVRLIAGDLYVTSSPNKGTTIRAEIPVLGQGTTRTEEREVRSW